MRTKEEIKRELDGLINDSDDAYKHIEYDTANIAFTNAYQDWYTRAVKLVGLLGKDRFEEFRNYYLINPNRIRVDSSTYVIQDYISGFVIPVPTMVAVRTGLAFEPNHIVKSKFASQIGIVKSLFSRIDSILSDVEGHLFMELQDDELNVASRLIEINLRAAGVIAGVVLERHLQRTAVNHEIIIEKKEPTISDLNDPLKKENIYDIPTWRLIQVLGDIRNLCVHNKEREPTAEEVKRLIKETDIIIKTIF